MKATVRLQTLVEFLFTIRFDDLSADTLTCLVDDWDHKVRPI